MAEWIGGAGIDVLVDLAGHTGHHRLGHEIVPVDAAIDDQCRGNDRVVITGLGEPLRQQRHFEGAGHVERPDLCIEPQFRQPLPEADQCLVDDIGVPARLDKSDFEGFCHCSDPFNNDKIPERTSAWNGSFDPLPHAHSLPSGL